MTFHSELRICIVGAGPRGLSTLERIRASSPDWPDTEVIVHLVDPFVGAGGEVWRTDQSHLLLMNTIASQVTLFTDDSVDCAGPVRPGPSLEEWARSLAIIDPVEEYPAHILSEARKLGPDDYPSRALYGHYLRWVLARFISTAPTQLRIRVHRTRATALADAPDGTRVLELAGGGRLDRLDAVVLAQGHLPMPPTAEERRLADHARRHGSHYLPPAIPSARALAAVRPGERIALRGMGLNFFDYLILLTQGRGGRFVRDGSRLTYRPSGREPVLYTGSRRGVPYHARGENQKGVFLRHEPIFLTEPVIARWRARARAGAAPRFAAEVWPLVSQEVQSVYYRTLLAQRHGEPAAVKFLAEFRRQDPDPEALGHLLDRWGVPVADRWSWERIAHPYGDRRFAGPEEYRSWLLDHLRADLVEAARGNVGSPLKAALDVLRDLRNEIRLVVDHAGISGDSYRDELLGWYTPLNAFLSIGPPAHRIAEMIALMEAGVLHVLGPQLRIAPVVDGPGYRLWSAAVAGSEVTTESLVDARLPEFDLRVTTDPLLTDLRNSGRCRPYRIPTVGGGHYETGGVAVTERPYRLVGADGRVDRRCFAFGVPTESVHWVTAAGIRPGVNSVILADADAIARACLAFAGSPVRQRVRQPLYAQRYVPLAWLPTTADLRQLSPVEGGRN